MLRVVHAECRSAEYNYAECRSAMRKDTKWSVDYWSNVRKVGQNIVRNLPFFTKSQGFSSESRQIVSRTFYFSDKKFSNKKFLRSRPAQQQRKIKLRLKK